MPLTFSSPETRVNTTTAEAQNFSAVADIPGYGYVVVWQSPGYNPSFPLEAGIFGQYFDYAGKPVGGEFLVSAVDNFGFKSDPAVIGGPDGTFTVSWTSFDTSSTGVYQRSFGYAGFPLGAATPVNTTTQGSQEDQQMARLVDGGHVVTWGSSDSDPAFSGVFARRYDAAGQPVGNDFRVSTSPTGFSSAPSVAALAGNGYVVAWTAIGPDNNDIFLQRIASDGTRDGGEILVNTTTAGSQRSPSVAVLNDGSYVVAWTSTTPDSSSSAVRGQRYDANGVAKGGEFLITDHLPSAGRPDITALADGGFAVAFESAGKVMLRSYDSEGVPQGVEWPIADGDLLLQSRPATALLGDGSFIVTWHNGDVYAERFRVGDYLTEGVDRAMGTLGSDYLEGFGGNDVLRAADGDDLLEGGEGADRLIGGVGFDEATYAHAAAAVSLNLQTGGHGGEAAGDTFDGIEQFSLTRFGDRFIGGGGVDRVYGMAGDDLLVGGAGADRLDGGEGNDVLEGGVDADVLIGGAGDDEVSYIHDSQGLAIDLTGTIQRGAAAGDVYSSIERFTLTRFDDTFVGTGAVDRVSGGGGNDTIRGGSGDDQLDGGAGNDLLDGGAGLDTLAGGAGDDLYVVDGAGDLVVELAGEGNDRVLAMASHTLAAGAEVELLSAQNQGGTAALNLIGSDLANVIIGNDGTNALNGRGGNDTIYGLGGDDAIDGGIGNDFLIGGAGSDSYLVDAFGDMVVEVAGEGSDRVLAMTSYRLAAGAEVELLSAQNQAGVAALDLFGSDLGNTIIGNDGVNTLEGRGGNDTIFALGGDDLIYGGANNDYVDGGAGADMLDGGAGNDMLIGGAGNDTFLVDVLGDMVAEDAGGGADRVLAMASYRLAAGAEVELLSAQDQNGIAALDLAGSDSGNTVIGNEGVNRLEGRGGNDVLFALGGDDLLDGGAGSDYLAGGAGADIFRFSLAPGAGNVDRIADFSGADDTIALDHLAFAGLAVGALAAQAFVIGTAAQDANDRIVYDQASGALYFDADGSGAGGAIQIANLGAGTILAANDFMVI